MSHRLHVGLLYSRRREEGCAVSTLLQRSALRSDPLARDTYQHDDDNRTATVGASNKKKRRGEAHWLKGHRLHRLQQSAEWQHLNDVLVHIMPLLTAASTWGTLPAGFLLTHHDSGTPGLNNSIWITSITLIPVWDRAHNKHVLISTPVLLLCYSHKNHSSI